MIIRLPAVRIFMLNNFAVILVKLCVSYLFIMELMWVESDYSLILISNRDTYYSRPALSMSCWSEDSTVYGGMDIDSGCQGGTWLAVTPIRKKLGLMLGLPGINKENANSRGRIVSDYVKSDLAMSDYIRFINNYAMECNGFVFMSADFGQASPKIETYSNVTGELDEYADSYLGFGNSLPNQPLKKVEAGKCLLESVCSKLNKTKDKSQLIDELIGLLNNKERHLPDPQLESKHPNLYKEMSSIYIYSPGYGTRAHTIMLLSKTGHVDLIEISMKSPINIEKPNWEKSTFEFDLL